MANDKLSFEILMSCMYQKDFSLVKQSNITTDVLMINQCDEEAAYEEIRDGRHHRMICNKQRGLSRSRNLALENSNADIVLFADNDEEFVDDIEKVVLTAFQELDADIIAFDLRNYEKGLKKEIHKLHLLETLKVSSLQIACKRDAIKRTGICFDINLGAGTPNGGGEENKFLWDAYKAGLKIYYYPDYVATLNSGESTWFEGFTKDYFFKRGKVTSYYMGTAWAFIYAMYFVFTKFHRYRENCSFQEAFCAILRGIKSEKNFSDS